MKTLSEYYRSAAFASPMPVYVLAHSLQSYKIKCGIYSPSLFRTYNVWFRGIYFSILSKLNDVSCKVRGI